MICPARGIFVFRTFVKLACKERQENRKKGATRQSFSLKPPTQGFTEQSEVLPAPQGAFLFSGRSSSLLVKNGRKTEKKEQRDNHFL
jgi:hypothetical protein